MKRACGLLLVFASAFALAGCGSSGDSTPKSVPADAVAVVGKTPITRAAFASWLAASRQSYRLKGQDFPPAGTSGFEAARNKVLHQLVEEAEYETTAKDDLGVVIADTQIDNEIKQYKHQYDGDSEVRFQKQLDAQGTTLPQMRLRIKQRLLADAVYKKVSDKVSVSDADIETYYRQHLAGYKEPAKRQVREILVETKAQADAVARRLRGGADFAKLARLDSIDTTTAQAGGVLEGGAILGQSLAPFDKVAFSIKTNAISDPAHTQYGWYVIQAMSDITPATTTPLDTVRKVIEGQLLISKRQTAMTAWVNQVKQNYAEKVLYAAGYGPPAAAQGG